MMLKAPPHIYIKKKNSDIVNNILISAIDFGFTIDLIVKNLLRQDHNFSISTKHRSNFGEAIEFFDSKK